MSNVTPTPNNELMLFCYQSEAREREKEKSNQRQRKRKKSECRWRVNSLSPSSFLKRTIEFACSIEWLKNGTIHIDSHIEIASYRSKCVPTNPSMFNSSPTETENFRGWDTRIVRKKFAGKTTSFSPRRILNGELLSSWIFSIDLSLSLLNFS